MGPYWYAGHVVVGQHMRLGDWLCGKNIPPKLWYHIKINDDLIVNTILHLKKLN
jgi:hypothetical protein